MAIALPGTTEALAAGEAQIGGKAFGLARLASLGAAVPDWRVIPVELFARHLARPEIAGPLPRLLAAARALDPRGGATRKTLAELAAPLQRAIIAAPLSRDLTRALARALAELGPGPYAVRSSMVGEDSARRSFAGQLESRLDQRTLDEVALAVREVWASSLSARALGYALATGLPLEAPRVGVVLQRMIAGRVSGVLFTADPASGRRDRALLTAAWGLGQGIVDGRCNTDEFGLDLEGNEETARVARKDVMVVRAPDAAGTIEVPVPAAQQDGRCLTPAETRQIVREGARLAAALGAPQDLEWTLEGNTLHILQARPITSLPVDAAGPRVVWDNSNIQESYCGVTTPLTFSFARAAYTSVYSQTLRALGLPEAVVASYQPVLGGLLGLMRGRIYYDINNWYRALLVLPSFGQNKADMERMMGLDVPVDFIQDQGLTATEKLTRAPRLLATLGRLLAHFRGLDAAVARFLAEFDAATAAIDRTRFAGASLSELMASLEQLIAIRERWHTPILNDLYVMMASGRLRRLVERAVQGASGPSSGKARRASPLPDVPALIGRLLSGEPGIESTEPTRLLLGMAASARADAALSAALEGEPVAALTRIRADFPAFASRIASYLERYGDRSMGELKLETVSLREDPSFLVRVLQSYLGRPDLDPDRLADLERRGRAEAERTVRAALPWADRLRFGRVLRDARRGIKHRENLRLARTRLFGLVRDVYGALGRRLAEAGRLDAPRDVFYLTTEEVADFHSGRAVSADLAGLARARRAEYAGYAAAEVPHHFETRGAAYLSPLAAPAAPVVADARLLQGTGCYPGQVESEARVILSPDDELSLDRKILVTLRTDPGWAPLFPTTSGILVERGSTLSHSAVVARELGIPAIVGIPGLLERVQSGERLRMDGASGVIERLS